MKTFTIAALFFGNFPKLAERLLTSLLANLQSSLMEPLTDIRLGLNNVGEHTFTAVRAFTELACEMGYTVYWYVPVTTGPVYKYPTMRRMLYGIVPVSADYFIWFDDDSVMRERSDWLFQLDRVLKMSTFAGIRYVRDTTRAQHMWINGQVWSSANEPPTRINFPQGSWWVADTKFLLKWNYPFPELRQCGGDSMLGQLLWAQCSPQDEVWFLPDNPFVYHNCDDTLVGSSAPRRGFTEPEFATDFVGFPLPVAHNDIDFNIGRYQKGKFSHARDFGSRTHANEQLDPGYSARRTTYQRAEPGEQYRLPTAPSAD